MTFPRSSRRRGAQSSQVLDLDLGPLTSENVRALAAWASVEPLDPAVLAWVDSAADGVPLFVEETLKMLEHAELRPATARTPLTHVPSTLQGLLTERLDRLPGLGDVVDVAAVLGREFDRELLVALWPLRRPRAGARDVPARQPGRAAAGGRERARCEFSHALLQEAAYERILRRRRQALHGHVAGVLTERFSSVVEREPELVAHHWDYAAEPEKAAGYWHAAGMRALERAAFLEAAEHFRRGLEALDAPAPRRRATSSGSTCSPTARRRCRRRTATRRPECETPTRPRRRVCERTGAERAARVGQPRRVELFTCCGRIRRGAGARRRDARARASRPATRFASAEGHLYRGMVHMYLANFEVAREHLEEAFSHYQRSDHFVQIYEAQGDMGSGALAYHALILWNLGCAEESREPLGPQPGAGRGASAGR